MFLKDKSVVVTGGTGSLGKVLVRRLLTGEMGVPRQITVFSRDEAKQHQVRLAFQRKPKREKVQRQKDRERQPRQPMHHRGEP